MKKFTTTGERKYLHENRNVQMARPRTAKKIGTGSILGSFGD